MAKQVKDKAKKARASKAGKGNNPKIEFPLQKENYILMAIGFGIVLIGFILMAGDENIYSFRKISLSVIFVMAGFLFEIYAIMKKPKEVKQEEEQTAE